MKMKYARISLSLLLIALTISFCGGINVRDENEDKQCVYVENIKEDVCASMKKFGECSVLLTVTMGGLTIYSNTTTVQQLSIANSQELCGQAGTCQMCFKWDVTTNEWGKATGCISLKGSCISSPTPLPLGCFEDSDLRSCPLPCKNDCSGNGECQYSGICDCKIGRYGDDCSAECTTEGQGGGQRIFSGNSTIFTASSSSSSSSSSAFRAYLFVSPLIAQINLTIYDVTSNLDYSSPFNYSIYTLKSCYPNPNASFYDQSVTFIATPGSGNSINIPVMSNCHDIDGGVWFFLIQCDNNNKGTCSFLLQVNELEVTEMADLEILSGEVKESAAVAYYQFNVDEGPFTFELTTSVTSPNVMIELLPFQCPSTMTFLKLTSPNYKDHTIAKYFLSTSTPQIGNWYAKISLIPPTTNNTSSSSSLSSSSSSSSSLSSTSTSPPSNLLLSTLQRQEIEVEYSVYYSKVECEVACIYGNCYGSPIVDPENGTVSKGFCYCQDKYSGPDCTDHTSLSYDDQTSNDDYINYDHSSSNNSQLVLSSIIICVVIIIIVCGCMICCIVGCVVCVIRFNRRKSSNNPRADSLYNMLTQEQDLTLDM